MPGSIIEVGVSDYHAAMPVLRAQSFVTSVEVSGEYLRVLVSADVDCNDAEKVLGEALRGAVSRNSTIDDAPSAVRTLAVQWAFRYIGSDVSLRETLTSAEDGTPIRLEARGQTSTLTDIDLLIEVVDGRGRIVERGKERMVARPARLRLRRISEPANRQSHGRQRCSRPPFRAILTL